MRVLITGATGFIGRALTECLLLHSHEVVALTRNLKSAKKLFDPQVLTVEWDGKSTTGWQTHADKTDAIVNLAGRNIGKSLWTKSVKENLLQSRLDAGLAVSNAIKDAKQKPQVLVQASAIGYYGSREDEELTEDSSMGEGFLAALTKEWENSSKDIEELGVRRVCIRTGLVLGLGGGVLPKMMLPFRFFAGGPAGSGRQWLSWIHLEDEVNSILRILEEDQYSGIYNLTAPNPVTMGEFCKHLGKAMRRPSWLPVPAFILKTILREMADETILTSQKGYPKRLLAAGFSFQYGEVSKALESILQ